MKITLFFSRGISLSIWYDSGLLDREIAPYKRMLLNIDEVSFVTYGKKSDDTFIKNQKNFKVLYNHMGLPLDLFGIVCPILYSSKIRNSDIYKTNQINGWWTGGIAKLLYGKPLVVRCGYLLSLDQERKGYSRFRSYLVSIVEKWAFKYSDVSIVTTPQIKEEIIHRYRIPSGKISVIPNSVDTELFCPVPGVKKTPGRICFVGRLSPEKNIELLLHALENIRNASLLIIGDGELREDLESSASKKSLDVTFTSSIPNNNLPELLNTCQAFVLTSKWEGMPKAMLEAMACGLPVIGTDVPGIQDIIENGRTGLLCKPDVNNLRDAINKVLDNSKISKQIGQNARDFIVNNYSLEQCVQKELDLLTSLVKK